jgi:hypothetical protein
MNAADHKKISAPAPSPALSVRESRIQLLKHVSRSWIPGSARKMRGQLRDND